MGTGLLIFIYIGLISFCGGEIIFKPVIARFAMFLCDAAFIRLRATYWPVYENQSAFFYCKLEGRNLSLNVLMKVIRYFFKMSFLMSF